MDTNLVNQDNVNPHFIHPEQYGLKPVTKAIVRPEPQRCEACGVIQPQTVR